MSHAELPYLPDESALIRIAYSSQLQPNALLWSLLDQWKVDFGNTATFVLAL